MAAEVIATAGHNVTIYDRMPSLGRKLQMAGRGGLNLTHGENLDIFISRYREAATWLKPHIKAFSPDNLRAWCEGLGQETFIGSSNRVFPRNMKAAPLLRAWLGRLGQLGVTYHTGYNWQGFEGRALKFVTSQNWLIITEPDATLLALGGASWPRLGSNGSWVEILKKVGVPISPLRPANCGFNVPWSEHFSGRFAGLPLKPVKLSHNGSSQQGEVMVTKSGMEGGAVYALSAALRETIEKGGSAILQVDLRPNMSAENLAKKLSAARNGKSLSNHLRKCGFSPIAISLLREVMGAEQLAKANAEKLAGIIKNLPLKLNGTSGLERAISTAGGIKQSALTDSFMLKNMPGVFAAGEMLDWEAPTGGYLLQACFSTSVAAAKGLLDYCEQVGL